MFEVTYLVECTMIRRELSLVKLLDSLDEQGTHPCPGMFNAFVGYAMPVLPYRVIIPVSSERPGVSLSIEPSSKNLLLFWYVRSCCRMLAMISVFPFCIANVLQKSKHNDFYNLPTMLRFLNYHYNFNLGHLQTSVA